CAGVAHRIASRDLDSETRILWYREMISGAYQAQWLEGEFPGGHSRRLLTFVVRRDHARYEAHVSSSALVRRIAEAEGILGTNRDYLYRTAEFLTARGIAESWLTRLAEEVRVYRIQQGEQK
ncbi:MAG: gamma-glutamylcyclotransferase, partial [Alphaproteobacteria bacterium]|nr:gamma-glutamylcyclotransferase [Alphaproteobacteria bacterium]